CCSAARWRCWGIFMPDSTKPSLESVVTCPACGAAKAETMPTDACVFFYDCSGCGTRLSPKRGDCCVFCSHGSVPCPPVQAGETPTCRPRRTAAPCTGPAGRRCGRRDAISPGDCFAVAVLATTI